MQNFLKKTKNYYFPQSPPGREPEIQERKLKDSGLLKGERGYC